MIGINGVNFAIPVATEKQKKLTGGKKVSKEMREKEVKKNGSRLSFGSGGGGGRGLRTGFDRQAMAVASY